MSPADPATEPDGPASVAAPKVAPERLELRARPRPVTRLSRRALIALGSASSVVVGGLAIWALSTDRQGGAPAPEVYSTERKPVAEGLETLPGDYAALPAKPLVGVPQLGPPLPGDLGRPIVAAGQQEGVQPPPPASVTSVAPQSSDPAAQARLAARQRLQQEFDAARRSALFVQVDQQQQGGAAATESATGADAVPGSPASTASMGDTSRDEALAQNGQDRKRAYVSASTDRDIYASGRLQTPASPYQVMAGTIIPAAMVTGLNSDLPGQAIATVTEPVYDTVTGRTLLIPQGSRLLGQYDAQVSFGQSRVLLVWNRLVMPDGSSIVLDRLSGADARGFAGIKDKTDSHWGRLLSGAALSTLLGIGAELGSPNRGLGDGDQTIIVATGRSVQDSANQVGQQITRRNLNVQPTLTVRPGFPVRAIVNKDLVLRPYGQATDRTRGTKP